jgi:hypothetical protein
MQSNANGGLHLDTYSKCVLTLIAILLGVIALQPIARPRTVSAESNYSHLYIEPRTTTLRKPDGTQQVEGKVVIDMRNGDVWGFPTLSSAPYPVDLVHPQPPVSAPMYLGQFDFSKMTAEERQRSLKP